MQYCFKSGLPLNDKTVVTLEENAEVIQRLMTADAIKPMIDKRIREIMEEGKNK